MRNGKPGANSTWARRKALDVDAVAASLTQQAEFVFGRDAMSEGLVTKALAVAKDNMRTGGGKTFGGKEKLPLESGGRFAFEPAQQIDAPRDTTKHGSQTAEKAGFWSTELHDLGPEAKEQQPKAEERNRVGERSDFALHGNGDALDAFVRSG